MPAIGWKFSLIVLMAATLAVADFTINDSPRMLIAVVVGLLAGGVVRFMLGRRRASLPDAGAD